MKLRLFHAPAVAAAMTMVRRELGPDAMILSTRRVAGGVEVTDGIEAADTPPMPMPVPVPMPAPAARTGDARQAALRWHGCPEPLVRRLQAGPLPFALSAALGFAPLAPGPGSRPLLVIGPPGAGKTLTIARLATRLVLAGQSPVVVTADGRRAGAPEQLAAFTRLLGLDLLAASQPQALARALAQRAAPAAVLVDAPGIDLFHAGDVAAMQALAEAAQAEMVLVLPGGLDGHEAADLAAIARAAGVTRLVATRLDLSRRLGGILAAAHASLALAELGVGPGAADGLLPATPALLARRLAATAPDLAEPSGARGRHLPSPRDTYA